MVKSIRDVQIGGLFKKKSVAGTDEFEKVNCLNTLLPEDEIITFL